MRNIKYIYDATVQEKLTQQIYNASNTLTKTTDYDGELIYQNDTLQFINTEEGKSYNENCNTGISIPFERSFLGNVRTTFHHR